MKFIEIDDGLAVIPCPGMVLKRVGEDQCALFLPGQSAVDGGFLIDRPMDEVQEEIDEALEDNNGEKD